MDALSSATRAWLGGLSLGEYLGGAHAVSGGRLSPITEPEAGAPMIARPMLSLSSETSVGHALARLSERHCISAPVCGPSGSGVVGWVDVVDIVQGFLDQLAAARVNLDDDMLSLLAVLESQGNAFIARPILDVLKVASDPVGLVWDSMEHSMLSLCEDGFLQTRPAHRVVVADEGGALVDLITQSDIIKLIAQQPELMLLAEKATVGDLQLRPGVISIPAEHSALKAFATMQENGVTAVALVDGEMRLIGSLSATHIRDIKGEHFGSLSLPCGEFLALLNRTSYGGYAAKPAAGAKGGGAGDMPPPPPRRTTGIIGSPPAVVSPADTIHHLITTIIKSKAHRVYVVDAQGRPAAVCSLTDILNKLLRPAA